MNNEYKKYWKVTIIDIDNGEDIETHNRVENLNDFIEDFEDSGDYLFKITHLTKEEYEETEK